jgi:PPM family protein phosphatase
VELMSIGECARRPRLSPKALRLYDKLGLLPPARVDADSGYRFYAAAQLQRARLVAALRQLRVPLAEIKAILELEPAAAAAHIERHRAAAEAEHTARRELGVRLTYRASAPVTETSVPDCDFAVPTG